MFHRDTGDELARAVISADFHRRDDAQALEAPSLDFDAVPADIDSGPGLTQPATPTARARAVRAAMLAYQQRESIVYTQHKDARWDGIRNRRCADAGKCPRWADASSFVTWCLWNALGGPDAGPDIVNGLDWKAGYTGTMLAHGHRVALASAKPGDLVLMGHSSGEINHVTIVVATGTVVSHGHPSGPLLLPIDYPRAAGGIQMIRSYLP